MPKQRSPENKGLPAGWRYKHGGYNYRVPVGMEHAWDNKKEFLLGRSLPEAYKEWAKRLDGQVKHDTISQLLDRYALQVIPTKEPTTQRNNGFELKNLRIAFGKMQITLLRPQHIYQYVDKRSAKVSAKREIALLSHAFTKAVEWGYINKHPFKGEVRLEGEKPRTRYVEDWEIEACLSLPPMRKKGSVLCIQSYIRLKLLTGLRRSDLLSLRMSDIGEQGISVTTRKTGKRVIYGLSEEINTAIQMAKDARPVDISPWLFCTKRGESYLDESTGGAAGWKSMWQRFFERVKAETEVKEHFTEHDLRAKCASDAPSLERARQLLAHADSRVTDRVYRRRPEMIEPL